MHISDKRVILKIFKKFWFKEERNSMTKEEKKQYEQQIDDAWKQQAQQYENICENMSKKKDGNVKCALLTCARNYYIAMKKSITNNGKKPLAEVRESSAYTAEKFPHTLETNALAYAWIMQTGNDEHYFKQLFPIPAGRRIPASKIVYEQRIYDNSSLDLVPLDLGKSKEPVDFIIPLVVLRYLLTCGRYGDELVEVYPKKNKMLVRTKYFKICIVFTGREGYAFEKIEIKPTAELALVGRGGTIR